MCFNPFEPSSNAPHLNQTRVLPKAQEGLPDGALPPSPGQALPLSPSPSMGTSVSLPQAPGTVDTLGPPLRPTISVPAGLLFSVNKTAWNSGAHLYKQPQCHQWTLVTVGRSPRFSRPAAQGLALRQGWSSILTRAGWGVGRCRGGP